MRDQAGTSAELYDDYLDSIATQQCSDSVKTTSSSSSFRPSEFAGASSYPPRPQFILLICLVLFCSDLIINFSNLFNL